MIERPATRDDLPAIVDLYCRYDERYRGGPDTDTGDVTGDWDSPGFDLADKTLVLEQEGAVVGYAVVDDDGDADTVTALDRPELDGRLVDWLEARGTALQHYAPDTDRALNALFEGRGWQPGRRFWRMRIEHMAAPPVPVWPPGVQVRDYDRPADDRAVHAVITEAFAEIGGQRLRPFEQWCSSLLDTEKYDATLYLVAEQDGEVVGAALSQDTGTTASCGSWPSRPRSADAAWRWRCCTSASGGTPPAGSPPRSSAWMRATRPVRSCSTREPACR